MSVFQKKGLASHASIAELGGIVAQKQKGLWRPVQNRFFLINIGTYGEISKTKLRFVNWGRNNMDFYWK
jgi:hypothetical protein